MLARLRTRIGDRQIQALFPCEYRLVFRAVIFKDAPDVFQQRKADDHRQKESHSDHSVE